MKLYRASNLPHTLAVATDGDEGELDEARPTTLRVTSLNGEEGRLVVEEFYGTSLFETIAAAQAVFDFEAASLCGPDGMSTRMYIQSAEINGAMSERGDDAVTYHARLSHGELTVKVNPDDDPNDEYVRLMEVEMEDGSSVVFKGEDLDACTAAAKRNLDVRRVRQVRGEPKGKATSPWREEHTQ